MQTQPDQGPAWAVLAVWGVVNAVCLLQAAGFFSRIRTGSMAVNHALGFGIIGLAVPAGAALVAFVRAHADWRMWIGAAAYLAFVALMVSVEYIARVEFRSPPRYEILVPYLVFFFGSIVLMGVPMFRINRSLWLVTAMSATFLIVSMTAAIRKGVG